VPRDLNDVDLQLLSLLQQDSTLSYSELGKRVGLSTSAVNERLKKLERTGVIRSWSVVVDPQAVDLSLCAFMLVVLDGHDETFVKRVGEMREVQECHHITGEFSYLLKIRVRDTEALEEFLMQKLKKIPGFSRTHTIIVLSSMKEETALQLVNSKTARSKRQKQ
jgi:Lrp/AsnC family leucine-responsive transcriptional regulator